MVHFKFRPYLNKSMKLAFKKKYSIRYMLILHEDLGFYLWIFMPKNSNNLQYDSLLLVFKFS